MRLNRSRIIDTLIVICCGVILTFGAANSNTAVPLDDYQTDGATTRTSMYAGVNLSLFDQFNSISQSGERAARPAVYVGAAADIIDETAIDEEEQQEEITSITEELDDSIIEEESEVSDQPDDNLTSNDTDQSTIGEEVSTDSRILTSHLGRVSGPSGSETYYNLNMSRCVERMHEMGYEGEYWVRDDGCKMFGDYIMVAADFSTRPLGTILETTRGYGIVVDTGDFVATNPTGIDIATTW